ncbi:MAG TPA: hypothetical protein VF628_02310 [Allosphingosinicella sp.]|jgi:hypothetical protein
MSLDADIRRIAYGGLSKAQQLRRMIRGLLDRHRLAARLFFGDDGKLRPDAAEWFAELADRNFVNRSTFHADPRVDAFNQGRRALAMDILGSVRLDQAKLDRLARELRSEDSE